MKTTQNIIFIILFLFSLESKCQNYKLDTTSIYFPENNIKFYFPKISHIDSNIESQINDIINRVIITELYISDTTITKLTNLPFEEMQGWHGSYFNVLYNKNSIISIEFIFDSQSNPIPLRFIKTFDILKKRELTIDEIINPKFKNKLFNQIGSKIDDEISRAIEYINSDEEFVNSQKYYVECYESLRKQQQFEFYIEELNQAIIIELSNLCIPGIDSFTYYYKYPEIKKYLKDDYKRRIN